MGGGLKEGGLSFLWKVSCCQSCCAGLGSQGSAGAQVLRGGRLMGEGSAGGSPGAWDHGSGEGALLLDSVVCPLMFPVTLELGGFQLHPLLSLELLEGLCPGVCLWLEGLRGHM